MSLLFSEVIARERSLLAFSMGVTVGTVANMTSTTPLTRSAMAGPAALYGTMVTSMPAVVLNSSISNRAGEPGPTVRKLMVAGFALVSRTKSATVAAGNF